MRRTLPWALALLFSLSCSQAADSPSQTTKSSKSARTTSSDPGEGESARSGNFFGRIFGKPSDSGSASKKGSSQASSSLESKSESRTETKSEGNNPGKGDSKAAKKSVPKEKPAPGAPEVPKTEDERFALAKKAASEDPKVIELRGKADASTREDDAQRLTRAYLRTLYGRMRTLEPTLKERIDLTEAAALRMVPEPPAR